MDKIVSPMAGMVSANYQIMVELKTIKKSS
jgi:hypothetical protein